jgi:hypothetical protein
MLRVLVEVFQSFPRALLGEVVNARSLEQESVGIGLGC